jgi:RNAse (barnase) inhibitor barstar
MAPFRLGHDEYQHELPWRLMQNGPVTMYWRREVLDADVAELGRHGFVACRFNCGSWESDESMHAELRSGLGLPDYTGANFNALADSLTDMEVPESGGFAIVLDDFNGSLQRDDDLIHVIAEASRWLLLFGRLVVILLRTDDVRYEGPRDLGATRASWNPREYTPADRGLVDT